MTPENQIAFYVLILMFLTSLFTISKLIIDSNKQVIKKVKSIRRYIESQMIIDDFPLKNNDDIDHKEYKLYCPPRETLLDIIEIMYDKKHIDINERQTLVKMLDTHAPTDVFSLMFGFKNI